MEDIVDTHFLVTATEGVHPSATTLLETVDLVAQHRVINVRVGDIVEVTADDDGNFRLTHVHRQDIGLPGVQSYLRYSCRRWH